MLLILISFLALTITSCKNSSENVEEVLNSSEVIFGIDVSQYQGKPDWRKVASQKKHPIKFVIMRSTMGTNREDKCFQYNWTETKQNGFVVGAYHFYDPNQNSIEQAKNYIRTTKLQKGNFIPIVDIEKFSKIQSMDRLRLGLQRWLDHVEKEYKVKPVIYTGHSFYVKYLAENFSGYPLWIAAYSVEKRTNGIIRDAEIHQFTSDVRVPGITENTVDGNDIKKDEFENLILKK